MRLGKAFPEIFRRPFPLLAAGTSILVAGTLLDTPRRDVLPIVRSADMKIQFLSKDRQYLMAFAGHAILSRLLERNPRDHYKFLFEPVENVALSIRPIPADEEITSLFRAFARTKLGWAIVEDSGMYALATLADLIPLYSMGVLETSLRAKDVATRVFALPQETKLSSALREMIKHSMRRVFLSGTNRFVSDREILTYIFSPERLAVVRNSPQEMLESTLEDVGSVESVAVDGSETLRESSELFKPVSGAWCLACREGVVTPWDLVMKPWKMGQLIIRDGMEQIHSIEKVNRKEDGFVK
ncbi:MAG: hypothetical protein ACYCPW_02980 [Nitrososphaerales archaeon]